MCTLKTETVRQNGEFNPIDHTLWHTYYTLVAVGMLYKLGTEIECICRVYKGRIPKG